MHIYIQIKKEKKFCLWNDKLKKRRKTLKYYAIYCLNY